MKLLITIEITLLLICLLCSRSVAESIECSTNHKCRYYEVYGIKKFSPVSWLDGSLSFYNDVPGAGNLDGIPLSFNIPPALNVTQGQTSYAFAFLSFITTSDVSVRCSYKGMLLTATQYMFQGCTPSMNVGDLVSVKNVTARVEDGRSLSNQPVIIKLQFQDDQNATGCLPIPFDRFDTIVDGVNTRILAGSWDDGSSVKSCVTYTITTATTTTSITTTTSTEQSETFIVTTASMDTTVLLSTSTKNSDKSSTFKTTQSRTSKPGTSTSSLMAGAGSNSASFYDQYGTIIISASAGGLALLIIGFGFMLWRRRRRNAQGKDIEEGVRRNTIMYASKNNSGPNGWDQNESSAYKDNDEFEEQLQFSNSNLLTPDGVPNGNLGQSQAHLLDPVESTLMNTQAVIALPGFLKLDFQVVRPERVMAEGGGGIIYEAELLDERLKAKHRIKKVAVKVVKNAGGWDTEEMRNMFNQEVSIMWSLSFHENIIKLIGFTEEPLAMIMKYYSQSMSDLIKNAPDYLTDEVTVRFTYHIVHALAEMHCLGVVHRDLKTANLLIDAPVGTEPMMWKIVVCDFGLARAVGQTGVKASVQVDVQGMSCRYAAPEVFARVYLQNAKRKDSTLLTVPKDQDINYAEYFKRISDEGEVEMKGDVYAFAIILWEILARQMSWPKLNNEEIEYKVREGERPPIDAEIAERAKNNDALKTFVEVMKNAWHQDPEM